MNPRPHRAAHRRRPARTAWIARAVSALIVLALAVLLPSHAPARSQAAAAPLELAAPITHPAVPVAPAPITRPAPAVSAPAPVTTATMRVRLHWGDTLWGLSHRYHTTVAALQELNALGRSTLIYAGRILAVPAAPDHRAPHASGFLTAKAAPAAPHAAPAHGPTGPTHPPTAPATSRGAVAVAFAQRQLGVPYLWGGTGAGGYDCSGLVQAAWREAGIDLPRTTYQQVGAGTRIPRAQLQPGDLVFSNNVGHVQLYVGHGTVIEAPHIGASVQYSPLPPPGQVDAYLRVSALR